MCVCHGGVCIFAIVIENMGVFHGYLTLFSQQPLNKMQSLPGLFMFDLQECFSVDGSDAGVLVGGAEISSGIYSRMQKFGRPFH